MTKTPPAIPPAIRPEVLEAVAKAICCPDGCRERGHDGIGAHCTAGKVWANEARAAITALHLAQLMPVLPGAAGEG